MKPNLLKITKNDILNIKEIHILTAFRRSLKLMKIYPSITRPKMRECLLIGYRENMHIIEKAEIKEKRDNGYGALNHIYNNELKRRELLDIDENLVGYKYDNPFQDILIDSKKKEDKGYVYF